MSAEDYTIKVIRGELPGMTLAFRLKHGFRVLAVVSDYLPATRKALAMSRLLSGSTN
ncbi:MAG: hypothetical protein ABI988_13980 [Nitrospirota bacterium]